MSVVLRLRPLHWRHRQACADLGGACRSPSRASRAKCLCLPALPFPSALPAAGLIRAQPLAWLHLQRAENARHEHAGTCMSCLATLSWASWPTLSTGSISTQACAGRVCICDT